MEPRPTPLPTAHPGVPSPTLAQAVRRYWVTVALAVIVLAGTAAALALSRAPAYKAETRLVVGKVDVQTPGLSGYVSTTQSLAEAYSQSIDTGAVVRPAGKAVGLSPEQVGARVSASAAPESPVFRVSATGSQPDEAIKLANATAGSLVLYIARVNQATPNAGKMLRRFRRASLEFNRQLTLRGQARVAFNRQRTAANSEALDTAQADLQAARLRTKTLSTAYEASRNQASTNLVQVLAPARAAASDRNQKLQLLIFIGVVAGVLVGVALATMRANRATVRARRLALRGLAS